MWLAGLWDAGGCQWKRDLPQQLIPVVYKVEQQDFFIEVQ